LKHGDTRADGYKFWCYHHGCKDGEWWVSPEKWTFKKEKALLQRRAKGVRERRPPRKTVPTPKFGDTREDGYRFIGFDRRTGRELWTSAEKWARQYPHWKPRNTPKRLTPEERKHRLYLRQTLSNTKRRAKENSMEWDLNLEYLASIFPKSGLCPLSKQPMVWGKADGWGNSPSLDRIDPSKGYVKGNVWWISHSENRKKAEYEKVVPPWVKVFADKDGNVLTDWRIERPAG
jgi:hypothetical protein